MKGLTLLKSDAIVERFDDFVTCLDSKVYDRPAQKFAREFLAAMLISKSTVVSVICRAVTTNQKSLKALYQKFWRRLDEINFGPAKLQQQSRVLREIQDDTVIAVDLGDITKPYAKTMDCLGRVADGSDDHKIKPGYWTLGAVAVNPKFEEKTPQPLELKVYSASSEGFSNENTLINEFIADVFQKTGGKGIFTINRGGDRIRIIQPLCELKGKFIIRLKDRILNDVETGKSFRLKEHIESIFHLPHRVEVARRTKNGKRVPMELRFGFTKVTIPSLKKQGIMHEMCLVTAWNDKHKRPMELLTTVPVKNAEDAIAIILNYLSRWSVEETYRFLKTSSNLEHLQLRSFGKLQNMVDACFLAASLTARMARYTSWQKIFEHACRRQKKAPDSLYNWMYRAADALALMLKRFYAEIRKLNAPRPPRRRKTCPKGGLFPLDWGI